MLPNLEIIGRVINFRGVPNGRIKFAVQVDSFGNGHILGRTRQLSLAADAGHCYMKYSM